MIAVFGANVRTEARGAPAFAVSLASPASSVVRCWLGAGDRGSLTTGGFCRLVLAARIDAEVGDMIGLVLLGVLALAVGGCACVVWAERGGPRWARVAANVTLAAGELLRLARRNRRRSLNRNSGESD